MKVFTEIQKFDQWWFRLIMVGIIMIIIVPIVINYDSLLQEDPTSLWIAFGTVCFTILLFFILSFWIQLETKIDEQGIYYGFLPFQLKSKHLPWREIKKCYVRKYNPIGEYGGWGYRAGGFRKKSGAMNVKGNIGIQIELSNGNKLLLGTQKENEAKQVLETYHHKIISS